MCNCFADLSNPLYYVTKFSAQLQKIECFCKQNGVYCSEPGKISAIKINNEIFTPQKLIKVFGSEIVYKSQKTDKLYDLNKLKNIGGEVILFLYTLNNHKKPYKRSKL